MTNPDYTHEIFVCDRTGSMNMPTKDNSTRAKDATRGVQDMIAEQAGQPGKLTMSLYEFDTPAIGNRNKPEINPVAVFASGDDKALRAWTCKGRGNTPLLDAVGQVVTMEGEKLAAMDEADRPDKVIVIIATDGQENDSRDWTRQAVRDLIAQQERDYNWKFVYIGASPEAFDEARTMGVPMAAAIQTSPDNIHDVYLASSGNIASYRDSGPGGQSVHLSYTPQQRAAAMSPGKSTVWSNPLGEDDDEEK